MTKKILRFYKSFDPVAFWSLVFTIICALVTSISLFINWTKLPNQLPLFYSLPWGEKQLATLSQFVILPSLIVLTALINLAISWHLHPSQYVLKRTLGISTLVISFLICITALRIINIFI